MTEYVQHQTGIERLDHGLDVRGPISIIARARLPKRKGEQSRTLIITTWGDNEWVVTEYYHETNARGNGRYVTSLIRAFEIFGELLTRAWSNIEEIQE